MQKILKIFEKPYRNLLITHSCEEILRKLCNQLNSNEGGRVKERKKKQELLTELGDAGYVESLHELGPNLRSETIAEHDANLVLPFFRHRCRR